MVTHGSNRSLRILNFISALSIGGAERQLKYLTFELERKGHDIGVGYLNDGACPRDFKVQGVEYFKIDAKSNYDPIISVRALDIIRRFKPDLVNTWIIQMDVAVGICVVATGTPWVIREPTNEKAYERESWKQKLRRYLGGYSDAVVANSEGGISYWRKHYPGKMLRIIPNGIDIESIDTATDDISGCAGIDSARRLVLYAGRFERMKNIDKIVSAVGLIPGDEGVSLAICGDGGLRGELEEQCRVLGIEDRVAFTGYLEQSVMWSLMKRADVFVFASSYEGSPNVVEEAAACGCPLVLSDISAHREIMTDDRAVFVDGTNEKEIKDAVLYILHHRDEAREMADRARKGVRAKSKALMAERYESLYEEVIEKRKAKACRAVASMRHAGK